MSKFVTLHGFGSSELNFKIKAYSSEEEMLADTPMENTIGVVTDVPITEYRFSTAEPEGMVGGEVWIKTGDDSSAAFDIIEGAKMCPLYAKQYINGAWASKIAKSYLKGEWVDWVVYLFYYGKQLYKWQPRGWKHSTSGQHAIVPTVVTNADGSLTFSITGSGYNYIGGGGMELVEDFDLTDIKTLELEFNYGTTQTYIPTFSFFVIPRSATYWGTEAVAITSSNETEGSISLNVSQCPAGSYNIGIVVWMNTANNSGGTITLTMKTLKASR